jgi:ribonuclease PH
VARLPELGERTIWVDCDVIQADGGTRTASITAGFIALVLALAKLKKQGRLNKPVLRDQVAAVSCGFVDGTLCLDLAYVEDSKARVDLNLVGTRRGGIVEIQGTAEGEAMPKSDWAQMTELAMSGVERLCALQDRVLTDAGVSLAEHMRT